MYFSSVIVLAVSFIAAQIFKGYFAGFIINVFHRLLSRTRLRVEKDSMEFLKKPLKLIFISTVMFFAFITQKNLMADYPLLLSFVIKMYRLTIILCIIYFIYAAVPVIMSAFNRLKHPDSILLDDTLLIFFAKIIKAVIVKVAVILISVIFIFMVRQTVNRWVCHSRMAVYVCVMRILWNYSSKLKRVQQ